MLLKPTLIAVGCAVALALSAPAFAADPAPSHARPTPEQMKAVRDCAAKQGVEMPPPPKKQEAKEDKVDRKAPPPKDGKEGPPKLTDAQKAIIDGCFKAQGLEPPKGPPPGGEAGGPPPPPPPGAANGPAPSPPVGMVSPPLPPSPAAPVTDKSSTGVKTTK